MKIVQLKFLLGGLLLLAFAVNGRAQVSAEFTYPEDLPDSSRKTFDKEFKQGKILYQISCAKCHAIKENGKIYIPDFSLPQLMDYELRIYPQHVEDMPDSKLADGELARIIVYLRYKQRSGKTIHPPPKE